MQSLRELQYGMRHAKTPELHEMPQVKPGGITQPGEGVVTKGPSSSYWLNRVAWERWKSQVETGGPWIVDTRTQKESLPSTNQVNAGREEEDSKWLIAIGLLAAFFILVMMREV